jgi:hypothetical protein
LRFEPRVAEFHHLRRRCTGSAWPTAEPQHRRARRMGP